MVQSIQNPAFGLMVTHLEHAAVELFAGYALAVEITETPRARCEGPDDPACLAVIGFVGDGLRGALAMIARESTTLAWLNAMGEPSGDPADVLGEFANMLLGRLKTRLLPAGLRLQVSTPTIACGNGLRLSTPPALSNWLGLRGDGWDLQVRLDTTFEASFLLREASTAESPAQAGEAIFF
jgi:CheY-specific phosphatase CheX